MTLKLVTEQAEAPVSLDDLKAQIGQLQSTDNEDALLQLKLDAATAFMRDELGRPLITSTWDLHIDSWPALWMYLPCNTQSIESIKYTDSVGVERTVDPSVYKLQCAYESGSYDAGAARLYLASGKSWPSDALDVGEPIVIRLVAGWKDAASVPATIKQAILLAAADMYTNRHATVTGKAAVSVNIALGIQRLTSVFEDRKW